MTVSQPIILVADNANIGISVHGVWYEYLIRFYLDNWNQIYDSKAALMFDDF